LADVVGIINDGRISKTGSPALLKAGVGKESINTQGKIAGSQTAPLFQSSKVTLQQVFTTKPARIFTRNRMKKSGPVNSKTVFGRYKKDFAREKRDTAVKTWNKLY